MFNLTQAQALAELRALINPTLAQLKDIVGRTSVAQVNNSTPIKGTILYSANYGDSALNYCLLFIP